MLAIPALAAFVVSDFWVPATPPRAQYSIECTVDPAAKRLSGTETIRFVNTASRPLSRLALEWMVTPEQPIKVTVADRALAIAGSGLLAMLDLPQPLAPRATIQLRVEFSRTVSVNWDKPVTLQRWYPRLWWGVETGDDYVVRIKAPDEYILATSGRRDPATGAWSANFVQQFGLFLARGLETAEANAGDTFVRAIFTSEGARCARLLLDTAVDAIQFYRKRFGFFPYRSLTILPGGSEPVGGYPFAAGMVVVHGQEKFEKKPESHWRWITAHEIGHQYWLEYVLARNPNEGWGWLMIGLGIYADREYSRARGITDQHPRLLERYIRGAANGLDTTLDRTPEQVRKIQFDFNNIVTHGKGFAVISALASVMGRDAFDRAYLRALREFAGRPLGWPDFQRICEQETDESLDWFFEQWVRSNRAVFYRIAKQSSEERGGAHITSVSIERTGTLKMPVPVIATFADGSTQTLRTERLLDEQTLEFKSAAALKDVRIDPDGEIAMVAPGPAEVTGALAERINALPSTGSGAQALALFPQARAAGLADRFPWFRLGLRLYDGKYYMEALEAFTAAEKQEPTQFGPLVWQGILLDLLGRRDEALARYKSALSKMGASSRLEHSQYDLILDRAWVEERLKTPFMRK